MHYLLCRAGLMVHISLSNSTPYQTFYHRLDGIWAPAAVRLMVVGNLSFFNAAEMMECMG